MGLNPTAHMMQAPEFVRTPDETNGLQPPGDSTRIPGKTGSPPIPSHPRDAVYNGMKGAYNDCKWDVKAL